MAVKRYKGDGHALYGSVRLPSFDRFEAAFNEELANDVLSSLASSFANYTYRFAMTNPGSPDGVFIYCLTHPLYVDESGEIIVPENSAFCQFNHYSGVDAGEFYEELTCDAIMDVQGFFGWATGINLNYEWQIVWSNFDATIQTDSGECVFTASDPISLDGMNVIEWDGVNEPPYWDGSKDGPGMYDYGNGTIRLAPYAEASNAVAVIGGEVYTYTYIDTYYWEVYESFEAYEEGDSSRRGAYADREYGICACERFDDEGNYYLTSLIAYTPVEEPSTVDFTISYTTAHGTAPSAKTVTVNEGESYTLTSADLPTLSASGYKFNGWLLNGSIAKAGDTISANTTLTASWSVATNTFTISYSTAHGTAPNSKSVTVNVGESYTLTATDLPIIMADGYVFGGWTLNGVIANVGDTISANATLVAVWEKEVTDFDWDSFVKGYKVGAALRRKRVVR